jgi:Cyclin
MPLFTLSSLTCHRFIISAIAVASKGLCDTFCTNNLYAKVGGITVTELNMLEREFLQAIDWRLTVSNYSYCSTPWRIECHSAVGSDGPFFIGCLFMVEPFSGRQCTREVLQEYYVNLIRTNSTGQFTIVTSSNISSDSEMDSVPSRSTSPTTGLRPHPSPHAASTILIDPTPSSARVTRRPTIEQNMAFADLQQSLDRNAEGDRGG